MGKENYFSIYAINLFIGIFSMSIIYFFSYSINSLKYISIGFVFLSILYKIILDKGLFYSLWYAFPVSFLFFIAPELIYYSSSYYDEKMFEAAILICVSGVGILFCSICKKRHYISSCFLSEENSNVTQLYLVVFLSFIYVYYTAPVAISTFFTGRSITNESSTLGSFAIFIDTLAYILPVLFLLLYKQRRISALLVILSICVVIVFQVLIGVRYKIIFTVSMFSLVYLDLNNINKKYVISIILSVFLLSIVSWALRGEGVDSFLNNLTSYNSDNIQQIFYYFAGVIQYYEHHDFSTYPKYSLFSLYSLFPRALWEGKPEMIGSWILDTGYFVENFSPSHSGSVSFFGPLYADFGRSALVFVFPISWLIIYLDYLSSKNIGKYSFKGILCSAIFPTIFFTVRSLNTSLINFYILAIVLFIYFSLAKIRLKL
ncbi:O-antigen polymerase [Vibrio breoganii]|uniref:O-antigen polymerase n=1 Tax=Vibrio breoganii TaxID=553239 RepID=UPI000C818092|nr:O-antigen polymerase [Vibrio breoganii]PMK42633.1 hypothetical protein BCU00_12500 [Vibrio breoganii]